MTSTLLFLSSVYLSLCRLCVCLSLHLLSVSLQLLLGFVFPLSPFHVFLILSCGIKHYFINKTQVDSWIITHAYIFSLQ